MAALKPWHVLAFGCCFVIVVAVVILTVVLVIRSRGSR
jgi:hypothetical protein